MSNKIYEPVETSGQNLENIYEKNKEKIISKLYETCKQIKNKNKKSFNEEETDYCRLIIILQLFEIVSKIAYKEKLVEEDAKFLIEKFSGELDRFRNIGLPGAIWQTFIESVEKNYFKREDGTSEFGTIFSVNQMHISRVKEYTNSCC